MTRALAILDDLRGGGEGCGKRRDHTATSAAIPAKAGSRAPFYPVIPAKAGIHT
jgi:hypothetical protein